MKVFVANFKLGSEVVDLYEYMSKCLYFLNEGKRDNMCKRFCWSARGINYITSTPLFQDIDIDCDINNVKKITKQVIHEYYGINAKILVLKKKSGNKYHIYYYNVFVDKIMLQFINNEVNKRLNSDIIDTNCSFPRLEGFNKWIWVSKPQKDNNGSYIHYGKGYYKPNTYYEPINSNFTMGNVYKKIYNFNNELSTVIKPISEKQLKTLTHCITGGKPIDFKQMSITDEQREVLS